MGSIEVPLPVYKTEGAVGMDLFAAIPAPVTITPGQRVSIPTGFAIAIPKGYEGQIRARSGTSKNHGIALANGVGTIDWDYRGPIMVTLVNLSAPTLIGHSHDYVLEPYERFAQLVICPIIRVELELVEELTDTVRGSGGFGHSGKF
jgi:dUTP pyrophosphatase